MTDTNDTKYPVEPLGPDDDDGTMPENVATLSEAVIGHRIVSVEKGAWESPHEYGPAGWWKHGSGHVLTLDNGTKVRLADTDDCCAYTALNAFLLHPEKIDHVITGVGTTDGYTKWHVYADMGDVLELTVDWSPGNPFYYGYGFDITVEEVAS